MTRRRKGLGTVIATVIFIFIMLFTVSNLYMWYFSRLDEYNQVAEQAQQAEEERLSELVNLTSAYLDVDRNLILNISNRGSVTAHLIRLWINHDSYDLDLYVSPGGSIEGFNTGVTLSLGEEYEVRVVTERGSIASIHLTPSVDARLSLIVPGTVYVNQEFTVVLLITNKDDDSYLYMVEPLLEWTTTPEPTLVEGPIPPQIDLLPPYSTVAFKWKFKAPGTSGTITFTGSFKAAGEPSGITDTATTNVSEAGVGPPPEIPHVVATSHYDNPYNLTSPTFIDLLTVDISPTFHSKIHITYTCDVYTPKAQKPFYLRFVIVSLDGTFYIPVDGSGWQHTLSSTNNVETVTVTGTTDVLSSGSITVKVQGRVTSSDRYHTLSHQYLSVIAFKVSPPPPPKPKLILFWDGDTIPSGWVCISDSPEEPFYERFPRGAPTYGDTGGTETHTHTLSLVSCSGPSSTLNVYWYPQYNFSHPEHTHDVSSYVVSEASNLPLYRNLKVIMYEGGIPSTIPAGAIAIFDSTPPAGWTRYSAQDGYFVRGGGTITTGGSNSHTHSVSITTGPPSATVRYYDIRFGPAATATHTHTASGTTASASNQPPYIKVILAKADSDTSIPTGMIGMFNMTPGAGWEVVSDSGNPFFHRFIMGSSTYGSTGGTTTHTHPNLTLTTGPPSATYYAYTLGFPRYPVGSSTHTHTITVSFDPANHLPPYIDVIFAKYTGGGTPSLRMLKSLGQAELPNAEFILLESLNLQGSSLKEIKFIPAETKPLTCFIHTDSYKR